MRAMRILAGSWMTTRAASSPPRRDLLDPRALLGRKWRPGPVPDCPEGPFEVRDRRPPEAHRGVAVGQPGIGRALHPLIRDADPAGRGVLAVHRQRLAVVPQQGFERGAW